MVAYKVKKWLRADKFTGAENGVTVAEGLFLVNELNATGIGFGPLGIGNFIPRPDNDADFLDFGSQYLFDDDIQHGFFYPVTINKCLQGEGSLPAACGRDDGFFDYHESSPFCLG
jgi:hypothetical protein